MCFCRILILSLVCSATLLAKEWDGKSYSQNNTSQFLGASHVLKKHQFKDRDHVLDMGCGDGRITVEIAKLTPRGSVLGIDLSPSMIEKATSAYPNSKYANLDFKVQDAGKVDFDKRFDTVVSFFTLLWLPDQEDLLKRIHKALKPNGQLVTTTPAAYPEGLKKTLDDMMSDEKWRSYFVGFKTGQVFPSPAEYKILLKNAGFKKIVVDQVPIFDEFESKTAFGNFVRQWLPHLGVIPTEKKDQFMMELQDRYLAYLPADAKGHVWFKKFVLELTAQRKPAV